MITLTCTPAGPRRHMDDRRSTPTLGLTPSSVLSPPGIGQTFSAVYSDADGYANLGSVAFLVNSTQTGVSGIYALYVPKDNKLYLYNDDKTDFVGTCTPALPGHAVKQSGDTRLLSDNSVRIRQRPYGQLEHNSQNGLRFIST